MHNQESERTILIVDDEPDNFDVFEVLLDGEPYVLHYAPDGHNALALLERFRPDAILLDVMMPGMDGVEVCQRIRSIPALQHTPLLMVTALTSKDDLARCLAAGADDFLSKPVDGTELRARLRSALRIYQQHIEIQNLLEKLQYANRELAVFSTRLEKKVQERTQQLEQVIFFDQLTQLSSRPHLYRRLQKTLKKQSEDPNVLFALLYIDCDQFQLINGSLGYEVGDQLLQRIAKRLQDLLRPDDLLARLDGDDFCFLLEHIDTPDDAVTFAKLVLESFQAPFQGEHYEIYVTACIGLVYGFPPPYQRPDAPLRDADTAVRLAKKQGKGRLQVFAPQMQSDHIERLHLENDLRRALHNQAFQLHYQPIWHLASRSIVGYEALLRWMHPTRGMIPPSVFIPCTEETGLIVPLGHLALHQACSQRKQWLDLGLNHAYVSVNLSPRQFSHPSLLQDLDQILEDTQLPPHLLHIEITESALMEYPQQAIEITQQIAERQISISIDDFGTGYSSLYYLAQFPIHTIKLDRSFTQKITTHPEHNEIARAVLHLGQSLQKNVIAEGIEHEEHLQQLLSMRCRCGQGYHLSRPLSPKEIFPLLKEKAAPSDLCNENKLANSPSISTK
ncbi:EAL domain-containing protein [Myxococcota bacterium]|nr:EAL domain-containing protein [Myxococcota bacterium]